jgi:hypothetical protein
MMRNSQQFQSRKPHNESNQLFQFEAAPEVGVYPADGEHLAQNSINLSGQDAANLKAYWGLDEKMLEDVVRELDIDIDQPDMVLRLYESSDLVRYHDIPVKNLKGCCRLQLQPFKAYYISLGVMDSNRFIPILTSNTVIKNH